MRKCLRCNVEMVENLDVKVEGGAYGIKITQQGIFKDNLGKVKCAVCPECGYIENYVDDTSKIKKLVKKDK
jgi:predicted nucleic-acid-binding Zn-ribbon protein